PSREGMTKGFPSLTTGAQELVVPRSMPIIGPFAAGAAFVSSGGGAAASIGGGGGGGGAASIFGGGGLDSSLGGGAVMPGKVVIDGLLAVFGGAGRAASTFIGGGGLPPSETIRSRPASSTARSCRPIPASGPTVSTTRATTAAARKAVAPPESCASSRTSVSTGRGCLVRTKNLFARKSSPYRVFTSSSVAQGSLICSPIACRLLPGLPGGELGKPPGGLGG